MTDTPAMTFPDGADAGFCRTSKSATRSTILSYASAALLLLVGLAHFGAFHLCRASDVYAIESPADMLGVWGGFALIALAVTRLLLHRRWFDLAPSLRTELAIVVLLTVAIVWFICTTGMWQIAGQDHATLIDIPWRMMHGQRLYRDFIGPFPAGFAVGAKWSFQLWGPRWASLIYAAAAFATVTFVWAYLLLRRLGLTFVAALLIAFATEAATQICAGHWWYNPLTSVSAILVLLSSLTLLDRPTSWVAWASFTAAAVLLGTMKPNAWALGLGCVAVLATSRRHWFPLAVAVAVAAGALILLSWSQQVDLSLMLHEFTRIAKTRGKLFSIAQFTHGPLEPLECYVMLSVIVAAAMLSIRGHLRTCFRQPFTEEARQDLRTALLCTGAILQGFILAQTNQEVKFTDLIVALVGAALLALGRPPAISQPLAPALTGRTSTARSLSSFMLIFVSIASVTFGFDRMRVAYNLGGFFSPDARVYSDSPALFHGVKISPEFHEIVNQVEDVGKAFPNATFFFGSRLFFGYDLLDKPAPGQLPVAYDRGTMYPPAMQPVITDRWKAQKFDVVIMLKTDDNMYYWLPPQIVRAAFHDYEIAHSRSWDRIVVLVRKEKASELIARSHRSLTLTSNADADVEAHIERITKAADEFRAMQH